MNAHEEREAGIRLVERDGLWLPRGREGVVKALVRPGAASGILRAGRAFTRLLGASTPPASVIVGGKRVLVPGLSPGQVTTWNDPGGLDARAGGFSKRRGGDGVIRAVVLHWGGLDPEHCLRALVGRDLSSHGAFGPGGLYQWLDLAWRAYHAGTPANDWSVGFDIAQSPRPEFIEETRERGFRVREADNPTDRGPARYVTLDPRTARQVGAIVPALLPVLGLQLRVPRGPDGLSDSGPVYHGVVDVEAFLALGGGVLGHHHLRKTKWDIAPYWDECFGGTPLG